MTKENKKKQTAGQGRTVSYLLHNKQVTRGIGSYTDRRSAAQLAVRETTRLTTAFVKTVKDFIEITFGHAAALKKMSAWNMAVSLIRKKAIRGLHPEQQIDFSRLTLSEGTLPPALDLRLRQEDGYLEYTWNPENTQVGMSWNDKVMVLAYFPEINKAEFILNGANRNEGRQVFRPLKFNVAKVIETYITFISTNHKMVSDSIYTGKLVW